MLIKDKKSYEKYLRANKGDEYGMGVIEYAIRWAELMEQEIEQGKALQDVAEGASHKADTDGITGFMYGCAVKFLAKCWEHGEDLRIWHNKEYGYKGDGTINPAVMTIEASAEESEGTA